MPKDKSKKLEAIASAVGSVRGRSSGGAGAVSIGPPKPKGKGKKIAPAKRVRGGDFSPTRRLLKSQEENEGPVLGKRLASIAAAAGPGRGQVGSIVSGALSGAAIGANIGEAVAASKARKKKAGKKNG